MSISFEKLVADFEIGKSLLKHEKVATFESDAVDGMIQEVIKDSEEAISFEDLQKNLLINLSKNEDKMSVIGFWLTSVEGRKVTLVQLKDIFKLLNCDEDSKAKLLAWWLFTTEGQLITIQTLENDILTLVTSDANKGLVAARWLYNIKDKNLSSDNVMALLRLKVSKEYKKPIIDKLLEKDLLGSLSFKDLKEVLSVYDIYDHLCNDQDPDGIEKRIEISKKWLESKKDAPTLYEMNELLDFVGSYHDCNTKKDELKEIYRLKTDNDIKKKELEERIEFDYAMLCVSAVVFVVTFAVVVGLAAFVCINFPFPALIFLLLSIGAASVMSFIPSGMGVAYALEDGFESAKELEEHDLKVENKKVKAYEDKYDVINTDQPGECSLDNEHELVPPVTKVSNPEYQTSQNLQQTLVVLQ